MRDEMTLGAEGSTGNEAFGDWGGAGGEEAICTLGRKGYKNLFLMVRFEMWSDRIFR